MSCPALHTVTVIQYLGKGWKLGCVVQHPDSLWPFTQPSLHLLPEDCTYSAVQTSLCEWISFPGKPIKITSHNLFVFNLFFLWRSPACPINPHQFYLVNDLESLKKWVEDTLSLRHMTSTATTRMMNVAEIRQVVIGDEVFSEKANYQHRARGFHIWHPQYFFYFLLWRNFCFDVNKS